MEESVHDELAKVEENNTDDETFRMFEARMQASTQAYQQLAMLAILEQVRQVQQPQPEPDPPTTKGVFKWCGGVMVGFGQRCVSLGYWLQGSPSERTEPYIVEVQPFTPNSDDVHIFTDETDWK